MTYDPKNLEYIGVRGPKISSGMLLHRLPCGGPYELECSLGIFSYYDSSTNLAKRGSGFVYLHIDVWLFQEADSQTQAANASADDG